MIFLVLSLILLIISAIGIGIIFWIKVSGNESISTPKMSLSWPSWLKGSVASYIGLGLFGLLTVLFLADFGFFHPILMIVLLVGVLILLVQDMKKLGWLKLIVLSILFFSIANYALSLRGDEVPSISEKAVEVAPATQPFLGDDRGTEEQTITRGEVVETVGLPPATQLPFSHTFSSSGVIDIEGTFTIQVADIGLITFDPATGDRTLPGGKTLNSTPESNQGAFPDPTKSWGVLLIRQNGGEWVHAQEFFVQPGVTYELTLNVNQEYRRYVQYRPGIRVNLYSE